MSETRTEWAAELTWPDGHTEHRRYEHRRGAELGADSVNGDRDTEAVAVLVWRTVTVGDWAPVPRASAVGVTI